MIYYSGSGVSQDFGLARRWFQKAAKQGEEIAQLLLGAIFSRGDGIAEDDRAAAAWYRLAAEQGNTGIM